MSADTLDQLWKTLGLDSLPADAGTAMGLDSTRMRDWEQATHQSGGRLTPALPERDDLPRLSLTPPAPLEEAGDPQDSLRRDLVVTGLLGEGGMGRVLLARQASLGRDVAVKVPRRQASQGNVYALLHEARITGALEHPGVIPVYSLASDDETRPALVMKRVDGVSWSMLLRHHDDPAWSRVMTAGGDRLETHVELLRHVCNAVAYAHRKGVLHRDLKPANVLIGEFGEVYVADWGIATRKLQPGETRRPSLVGSPVYLAPEMVTGDDALMDERTDVFLLGSILYEILTGDPPWTGPDLRSVLEAAFECKPRPPPPTVNAELAAICARAMAREPAQRFASALEFRDALSGFLQHRGSVKLAQAAEERLDQLLKSLKSTAREDVFPLFSECRFGFTQALREWPANQPARLGLARCLEAMAYSEIERGHLAGARAVVAELEKVPPELHEALIALEHREAEIQRRQARLERLSQELDPRVAIRQRVLAFAATAVAICFVVFLPVVVPQAAQLLQSMGRWYLTIMMLIVNTSFGLALWIGRRSLLSTRLNRRLMGLVGAATLGTLIQRVTSAILEQTDRATIFQNFAMVFMVCCLGGLMMHAGFFWSAVAVAVGAVLAVLLPGLEGQLFALACIGAMGVAVLSWRTWKGELSSRLVDPRQD